MRDRRRSAASKFSIRLGLSHVYQEGGLASRVAALALIVIGLKERTMKKAFCVLMGAAVLIGCAETGPKEPVRKVAKDGDVQVPADYKSWPKFLSQVQRPDAKQVREIYINPTGQRASAGKPFPNGTVFVMENYAVVALPDGALQKGSDGKLVKGQLVRVFVMEKGAGWGANAPAGLQNGDWVYSAFLADGKPSGDNMAACRSCHLPLADKDYVHRYDEYFQTRAATPAAR